jgi:two-component system, NarL family, invasion response regulator UvrY
MKQSLIKVGMVDDHIMVRDALANVINSFEGFTVTLLADNGKDFINKLNVNNIPDILLVDLNMPEMDGGELTLWLSKNRPEIKILILTMFDAESLIHMIKSGVCGFLKKDATSSELKNALTSVKEKSNYCSHSFTSRLFSMTKNLGSKNSLWGNILLNENEIAFLKLITTEMTYKEIAQAMKISPRTVDNYRDSLFLKLSAKCRVGLVMYAVRAGIISINY